MKIINPYTYEKCPLCKKLDWIEIHKCPTAYGVRLWEWHPEDEVQVFADSAEEAATTFLSDRLVDFDYPNSATVAVNDWRTNREYRYEITVEMEPVFCAELVSEVLPLPASPEGEGKTGDKENE